MEPKCGPTYDGAFNPPPAHLMTNAIGWTFMEKARDLEAGTWTPMAWTIIYPDHILTVDYRTELAVRDTLTYAP